MTDKHIPASKLLALKDYWDERMGCMTVRSDDLRALIDAETEKIPLCNLWVNPDNLNYEVDHCEHPLHELIPVYTAPPADNLIADKQATIDRLTSQRDMLLSSLKLNVPDCEAVLCNAKATYEYQDYEVTLCKCEKHKGSRYEINDDWNEAVRLIAEIEANK